jgi:predicted GTPase
MSKTKLKSKQSTKNDFDIDYRKVKKQKSLYDKKQYRQIDNILKTRNVDKIFSYSDEQY